MLDNIPTPVLLAIIIVISFLLLIRLGFWLKKRQTNKINEEMQSWVNRRKDDLLMSWGPPTSVFPMDNGKEIWTYSKVKQKSEYIPGKNSDGRMQNQMPEQYIVKRDFFINELGIIFHFRWENF